MRRMARAGLAAVIIVAAAETSAAELTPSRFMAALRRAMQQQGAMLPAKDDCHHSTIPCQLLDLPKSLSLWAYPSADGRVTSVRIVSDGTKGDPDSAAEVARMLCMSAIRLLTDAKVSATALRKPYEAARLFGEWKGDISTVMVQIRLDDVYPLGLCHLNTKH